MNKYGREIFLKNSAKTTLFFIMLFIVFSALFPILFSLSIPLIYIALFLILLSKEKLSVGDVNFIIILICVLCFSTVSLIFKTVSIVLLKNYLSMISLFILGYCIKDLGEYNHKIAALPLIGLLVVFGGLFFLGKEPRTMLALNSENFISVTLISAYFVYIILSRVKQLNSFIVVSSFAIFIFCMLSIGRSGILAGAIIFIGNLLLIYSSLLGKCKGLTKFIVVLLSSLLIVLLLYFSFFTIIELGLIDRLIERGLTDYSRLFILTTYLDYIATPGALIGGVHSINIQEISRFAYNLHNSYLSVHSNFGLLYFIFFMVVILFICCDLVRKHQYLVLFPFIALLLRASTDVQLLSGKLDWIVFSLLFIQLSQFHFSKK